MNDSLHLMNEEEVKIKVVIPWLESLGYKTTWMEFEKTIEVSQGKKKKFIFADIVVYTDKKKQTPIIVVDTKSPKEILSKNDRDQVISYARLLDRIAPFSVLANGINVQVFKSLDKSRIKSLPKRKDVLKDFVSAVLSNDLSDALKVEARRELFAIDDVSTFKSLLKKCHNTIRNNEGYDPIKAFDELSKVLFSKMYEEQYNMDNNRFNVETYETTLKQLNVNIVQQQFAEIQKVEKFASLFDDEVTIELKDRTIKSIVEIFESYDLTLTNFDVKGEAFEFFLGDTFTGGLGEYFTPRNVVEFIVEAVSPKIGQKILDPFCGTGGFLIYAFDIISNKINLQDFSEDEKDKWREELSDRSLYGTDWKDRTSQACKMNMIVHGDGNTGVYKHDGFVNVKDVIVEDKFDLCITNPPFGSNETDSDILEQFVLGQGRTSQKREILAIERCLSLVKKGKGVVAIILPDGILNGDRNSYVREFINQNSFVFGVVGLNKETFEGYNAGVKTSILFLKRKENPDNRLAKKTFMAVCTNTGYAPTGEQISGNQLPDILYDFKEHLKKTDELSFLHPHCAVIKLKDEQVRFDAERYIDYMSLPQIPDNKYLSNDLLSTISDYSSKYDDVTNTVKRAGFINPYTPQDFTNVPINLLVNPIEDIISVNDNVEYKMLGIRGNGGGIFIRELILGQQTKAKKLNRAKYGWFVFSRLFAKNGSFAIVGEQTSGGLFSNEFPTFKLNQYKKYDINDLAIYLMFYMNSPQSLNYIIRLTTGSTKASRGRFKESQFMELNIPLPKKPKNLKEIANKIRLLEDTKSFIKDFENKVDIINKSFQISFPQNQ